MSLFKKTKFPSEPHVTEHKDAILFLFLAPINHKGIKQHIAEVFAFWHCFTNHALDLGSNRVRADS